MKKLSDGDILKWLKSDEESNFVYKEKLIEKKDFPKPNQITRDTLRKILKGKIKIDAEIDLHEFNIWQQILSRATMFTKKNPFYDEEKAIELGDQYTESEYITDWDKVKSWLEGDKEYAGKK